MLREPPGPSAEPRQQESLPTGTAGAVVQQAGWGQLQKDPERQERFSCRPRGTPEHLR